MTFPSIPPGRAPSVPDSPQAQVQARMSKLVRNVRAANRRGPISTSNALPAFYGFATAPQTIADGLWQVVTVASSTIDDDGIMSGGHAEIQRPGVYVVAGSVPFPNVASPTGQVAAMIALNAASPNNYLPGSQDNRLLASTTITVLKVMPIPVHLDAGDTVYLMAFQTDAAGGLATVANGPTAASLSVVAHRLD